MDLGGAENYTVSLMNTMNDKGHDIYLKVLSNELKLRYKLNTLIKLEILQRNWSVDINVLKKLILDIKKNDYNAIISSSIVYARTIMFFSKKTIPVIYPIHSTISLSLKYYIINYILFKTRCKREIFVSSVESQTKYLCKKYSLWETFFDQIYNGVNINQFKLMPEDFNREKFLKGYGINSSDKILLMVAGYRPEKGHSIAINAFKMLSKEIPDLCLIFVGNDPFNKKKTIEETVSELKGKIVLFDNINEEDLIRFYWSAEMFTLTSFHEAFPISALEAMATGLPCVLTNVGGANNIILSGRNGELATVNDLFSIKESWKKVLMNKDRYCKENIRLHIVNNYSLESATNNYIDLIKKYKKYQ
ncbi:MAG TPA: glycosyltransferase family 4 protein [Ignavibacteriaceae bacterium]|nr:glycosyltransferase family 4 protein [Ignavibacteriaceae bacterium]